MDDALELWRRFGCPLEIFSSVFRACLWTMSGKSPVLLSDACDCPWGSNSPKSSSPHCTRWMDLQRTVLTRRPRWSSRCTDQSRWDFLPPVLKLEVLLQGPGLEFSPLSVTFAFKNVRHQLPLSHSLSAAHYKCDPRKGETPHLQKAPSSVLVSPAPALQLKAVWLVFFLFDCDD